MKLAILLLVLMAFVSSTVLTGCKTGKVDACETCDGTGLCTQCHGAGERVCSICDGTGKVPCPHARYTPSCRLCGGTGLKSCTVWTCAGGYVNCLTCKGTGVCQTCKGTGVKP
jgi:hypothetical protein